MAKQQKIKRSDPWWVIVLKVLAYAIGLCLAGYATPACLNQICLLGGLS